MAGDRGKRTNKGYDEGTPPEAVAGGSQLHPLTAAAMIGGALAAAGAGAYIGTRALARRNGAKNGKVSSVMATAITACDLAQKKDPEASAAAIPIHEPGKPGKP